MEEHVLLLGDAAGTIAPLCGNGMSMGMHASFLLAHLTALFFAGSINRQQLEQQYAQAWNGRFSFRTLAGRTLQQIFGQPQLTSVVIRLLKAAPPLADALVRLTHGKPF